MVYLKKGYIYDLKNNILRNIVISIIIGSILGALFFVLTPSNNIYKLSLFLESFIKKINDKDSTNIITFIEIFLKNIKYIVFIWFLAFIFLGEIYIYIIILSKGFFITFTSSIFFSKYEFKEILYTNYIIENLFSIIFIFYISYKGIEYCRKKRNNERIYIHKYIKHLVICLIFNIIILGIFYYL